jgi:hypothetical protein
MEDPLEVGNLPCGRRHGDWHREAVDAVGTSYRWWKIFTTLTISVLGKGFSAVIDLQSNFLSISYNSS